MKYLDFKKHCYEIFNNLLSDEFKNDIEKKTNYKNYSILKDGFSFFDEDSFYGNIFSLVYVLDKNNRNIGSILEKKIFQTAYKNLLFTKHTEYSYDFDVFSNLKGITKLAKQYNEYITLNDSIIMLSLKHFSWIINNETLLSENIKISDDAIVEHFGDVINYFVLSYLSRNEDDE